MSNLISSSLFTLFLFKNFKDDPFCRYGVRNCTRNGIRKIPVKAASFRQQIHRRKEKKQRKQRDEKINFSFLAIFYQLKINVIEFKKINLISYN